MTFRAATLGGGRENDLRVVICYEDFESGVRAMDMYQRLLESGSSNCPLKIWKIEPLGIPQLLTDAIQDAASADMIILSVRGDRPLPYEALPWLESLRNDGNGGEKAIVFLVDPKECGSAAAVLASGYLERLAAKSGLRFFTPTETSPVSSSNQSDTGFRNRVVGNAVTHSARYDRWGLNE